MSQRSLLHALFVLVLLLTQQLGVAPGIAHWQGARDAGSQAGGAGHGQKSTSHALTEVCDECLAFAQIGPPLAYAGTGMHYPALHASFPRPARVHAVTGRTIRAYHAQGPPQA